jgi:hypothetical protein
MIAILTRSRNSRIAHEFTIRHAHVFLLNGSAPLRETDILIRGKVWIDGAPHDVTVQPSGLRSLIVKQ